MNLNDPDENQFKKLRRYYTTLEPTWQKPRNRIYTAIIFSFLAISLFGWYAIRPTVQTILYLRREIADKTIVNQQMEQKITDLIQARSELDAIQPQLSLLEEVIPREPEALDLALQMKNLIGTTEATLSSLHVSSVPLVIDETEKNPKNLSTDFTIESLLSGGYPALEEILGGILSMRRIISVKSMNFTLIDKSADVQPFSNKEIKLSIHVKSYYK